MSSMTSARVSANRPVSSSDARRPLPATGAAARDEAPVARLDHVEHALSEPLGVDEARVDAQALGQGDAVLLQALADLVRRGERMLGRDVVAVGAQAAEVGGARVEELGPEVGEVRRHLDADAGQDPPCLLHQAPHVLARDRRRPGREVAVRAVGEPGAPVALGRLGGDLGRLLAVVAPVRDEVLQDHLLQVAEAGERLQGLDPVLFGLSDPDQDPAGERDPEVLGVLDRLEAERGVLGR
jgi:hypothetical protein